MRGDSGHRPGTGLLLLTLLTAGCPGKAPESRWATSEDAFAPDVPAARRLDGGSSDIGLAPADDALAQADQRATCPPAGVLAGEWVSVFGGSSEGTGAMSIREVDGKLLVTGQSQGTVLAADQKGATSTATLEGEVTCATLQAAIEGQAILVDGSLSQHTGTVIGFFDPDTLTWRGTWDSSDEWGPAGGGDWTATRK